MGSVNYCTQTVKSGLLINMSSIPEIIRVEKYSSVVCNKNSDNSTVIENRILCFACDFKLSLVFIKAFHEKE